MGAHRNRPTVLAALLLAALSFAGVVAEGHRHGGLDLSSDHEHLPAYSAGHEEPDRTVHVDGATRVEPESCLGCLQRQRQRATARLEGVLGGIEPSRLALAADSTGGVAAGARRLPASRAPPRA